MYTSLFQREYYSLAYRPHVLLISMVDQSVRLLSMKGLKDSQWHGLHNYEVDCEKFFIINFSYFHNPWPVKHTIVFQRIHNLGHPEIQRYLGFELSTRNVVREMAEIVMVTPSTKYQIANPEAHALEPTLQTQDAEGVEEVQK